MDKVKERGTDTIEWLREIKKDHPNLSLQTGSALDDFFKTSESFQFRYYFILNNQKFAEFVKKIRAGENYYLDANLQQRRQATDLITKARNVDQLINLINTFMQRAEILNREFKKLKKEDINNGKHYIGMVVTAGIDELTSTIKKTVRIAL